VAAAVGTATPDNWADIEGTCRFVTNPRAQVASEPATRRPMAAGSGSGESPAGSKEGWRREGKGLAGRGARRGCRRVLRVWAAAAAGTRAGQRQTGIDERRSVKTVQRLGQTVVKVSSAAEQNILDTDGAHGVKHSGQACSPGCFHDLETAVRLGRTDDAHTP
jgi:hypothetical protein